MTTIVLNNTQYEQYNTISSSFHPHNTASQGLTYSARPLVLGAALIADPLSERFSANNEPAELEISTKKVSGEASSQSSETSYDEEKSNSPKAVQSPLVINIEEDKTVRTVPVANKTEGAKKTKIHADGIKIEEGKGLGGRDHYLSRGKIVFKILSANLDEQKAKISASSKPYYKFRMGFNTAKTKAVQVEGSKLVHSEDVVVNYTNQDSVMIKIKGKGKLGAKTIAKVRVAIVDVVMREAKTQWFALLKGDEVVGKIKLSMEFQPAK